MSDETVREYVRGTLPQGLAGRLFLLVNPFIYLAGWQALLWGLLVVAGTAVVAVAGGVHYDGVMDLHVGPGRVAPWLLASEAVADWLIVALVFWAGGRIFSRSKQRAIDYFGTTALGRFPYLVAGVLWMRPLLGGLIAPLAKLAGAPDQAVQQLLHLPGLIWLVVGVLFTLVLGTWLGFLNYFAVKESSGLKTGPAIGLFFGGALVAEIISKLVIILAFHAAGVL